MRRQMLRSIAALAACVPLYSWAAWPEEPIAQMVLHRARGVAVLRPDISDSELRLLHVQGIRAIRFTLYAPENAPTSFDMVEPLACRIKELGWHLELHWTAEQIVAHEALHDRLPVEVVFDHLGGLLFPQAKRLFSWVDDQTSLDRILASNPTRLYWNGQA